MDYLSKLGLRLLLLSIITINTSFAMRVKEHSVMRPTIFFDLGNTLIDTSNMKEINYFANAKSYVEELKALGLRVALITNIPEKWGTTYIEKITTLKKFIADNWVGDKPFDWDAFDQIIIPLKDSQRKPRPYLYNLAIKSAPNCPLAYVSENPKEVAMAKVMGFVSYNVNNDLKVNYLPEMQLIARIQSIFNGRHSAECFDHIGM